MSNKSYEDVMNRLKQVPKVNEHLNSTAVIMGKQILKRRLELGLTQQQVIALIEQQGKTMTQARLSKIETGDSNITTDSYDKVFEALGELDDLKIEFRGHPKNHKELENV